MSRVNVLVASTAPDLKAGVILESVAARDDMTLVENDTVDVAQVETFLARMPASEPCAVVLIGPYPGHESAANRWLAARNDLVVLHVDITGEPVQFVRISLTPVRMDVLLNELRGLVDRAGAAPRERVRRVSLQSVPAEAASSPPRPLLEAALHWIHLLLRDAVEQLPKDNTQLMTPAAQTLLGLLDAKLQGREAEDRSAIDQADSKLGEALAAADPHTEPLSTIAVTLALTPLEWRLLLLGLAPELDPLYQRCLGALLDDMGRRVGTLGVYSALLARGTRIPDGLGNVMAVRQPLAHSDNLGRWRLFDARPGSLPPADEPLRLDPAIAGWLLGEPGALEHDPRVRRAIRLAAWPGSRLLDRAEDRERGSNLLADLLDTKAAQWILFAGEDTAGWRALLELGAGLRNAPLLRVQAARLLALDVSEIEESAVRLGRLAHLAKRPIVLDATRVEPSPHDDDALRVLLAVLRSAGCRSGIICTDVARIVRLVGAVPYTVCDSAASDPAARAAMVRAAAKRLDIALGETDAAAIARRFPLSADGLELAMRLARARSLRAKNGEMPLERFAAACKEVAAEGLSNLAERLDPVFDLPDVVLPPDRTRQLEEIVDSVRYAPKVLDEWNFRDQLPYGRGVTALFHGASGTGKTMAAHGVARKLGVQVLRFDLSRVVSKYIGDTEKNIDRVFSDAQRSGAAILIDEADALLGKRSEVKDAHDRYANIEVAYLLQRMEAYEGLAILTTNMRQNLDPAFLRRLRFIVEFPRPDADARGKIWRRCLPAASHELDDAAFWQLARKIDLTGGHIRQITLRAAFAAAAAGTRITLAHIAYAARAEFAKLGMPAVEIEPAPRLHAA